MSATGLWFTSDLHFGHRGIIKHCGRPFADADEMDAELVRRWNACVKNGDRVYVLGDVSFRSPGQTIDLLESLNGQKYLIAGNHDSKLRKRDDFCAQFVWVKDLATVKVHGLRIALCHFPLLVWDQMHRGALHFHGHSHGTLMASDGNPRIDVGADCWSFAPVSFEELDKRRRERFAFKQLDHHSEKAHPTSQGAHGKGDAE